MANVPNPHQEEELDLREELQKYLRRWPLFAIGVAVCLAGAFVYLRYATPTYNSLATIIIKDEKKGGGMASELAAFADMGMFSGMGTNSIENEIGILRSKRLMTNVVKELHLHVRYFQEGVIRTPELFEDRPFNVQLLAFDTERFLKIYEEDDPEPLFFEILSDSTYVVKTEDGEFRKKMNFGEAFTLPYAEISVTPNFNSVEEIESSLKKGQIKVTFSTVDAMAAAYRQKLQVNLTDKNSSLIELSLEDQSPSKARTLLDQLIYQYNREAIEDKNLVSLNTANFIEDRLAIITEELDSVETGKEQFKKENKLTNIEAESELFIENVSDFRNRQLEVETQLELANTMIDYLKEDDGLLPSNLGFKEEGVVEIIQSYNQLVLERDRILAGSTERNPVIVNLNNQIAQIRANVLQSLKNLRTSLQIARNDLNAQEAKIDAQIATVPSKEKEFRNIERQQNIKEALYLFLLQKREETSLSLAVTAPKAKIVDAAYSTNEPISPKPKIILLAALILGLLIPFLYIYLKQLLNNKIQSRADIEEVTTEIPIVGEIPSIGKKDSEMVLENDRSVLGESFRILHTNLQYLLAGAADKDGGNSICVTSTVKGEGKTFVAYNFALTLANTGKKVLIVGADLRNPQLQRYETDARQYQGVSDYLVNNDLELKDLINKSAFHPNLDMLPSGTIPPNPSELWRGKKTPELFAELESMYDYVVVDTAPSLLVTDTFLINHYADLTLYVSRAGYTEKKLIQFAVDSRNDGKLKNVSFVLNDVKTANFGYGNKYGYAYGEEQISFWDKIKDKAAFW
ncbi:capsular exopolysaccharide family [Salinimicrobium catena]|uniref:non-specific protein-tyrosine kinase n=1 Tax=Salinimicrobium catena TaxID=390640 RepID=A0A1H5PDQ1_9FLAO|nr:polysaccharide biosynthesis tyrosine autokinase [Salinimicrobium catena]SDL80649.1 capsular exopolysaccharide family [Salinimicrobium catena]SEF12023.1 capsular exopolysaccharide family [Salinimicrobium catena]